MGIGNNDSTNYYNGEWLNDKEYNSKIIDDISVRTGVKYSDEQRAVLEHKGGMCILACAGSGKALRNDTPILTPKGWTPISELQIGDKVFNERGKTVVVRGVFPQGLKEEYQITFSDGTSLVCCADHLWAATRVEEKIKVSEVWTTSQLQVYLLRGYSLSIPINSAISFYTGKDELDSAYEDARHYGYNYSTISEIPDSIKFGSIKVRKLFFDTLKGHVVFNIAAEDDEEFLERNMKFNVLNKEVRDDIIFIIRSLGYLVKEQEDNEALEIEVLGNVFDRVKDYNAVKWITSIKKTGKSSEMTCIAVTGKNKLYIAKDFIVTHNTTVLTHLIAKRILTKEISDPSKLLCTTYSRAGAEEMEERLRLLLNKLGENRTVKVGTLHAICRQLLVQMGYPCHIIENSAKMKMIREACKENEIQLEEEDYKTLESLFSFQINNLMSDAAMTKSYVYTLKDLSLEKYSAVRKTFNTKKQTEGVVDFDDLQLMMYSCFINDKTGALQKYCHDKWKYIYVDEAQDVSKIQFAILKYLVSDPNNLVFIGDDDQAIYAWRGADPSIILDVCGVYPELTQFTLTTNYRCYGDIVRQAAHGIQFNRNRSQKTMTPANEGGQIKVYDCGGKNIYEMSKPAYQYIKDLVINKGVNPADIAVLSRNNQHLTILANMLFKDGIYCKTSDEMVFTKSKAYRVMRDIISFAEDGNSGLNTRDSLRKVCAYMSKTVSDQLGNIQASCGAKTSDLLGYLLTKVGHRYDVTWEENSMVMTGLNSAKLPVIWQRIYGSTSDSLARVYYLLTQPDREKRTAALMDMCLMNSGHWLFPTKENQRFADGVVAYLSDMIQTMGMTEFERYMQIVTQFEYGKMAIISPMISMTTIHGAKGREWKHVIIFADDNVSFPSFEGIQQNIKDGVSASDINKSIDESRRLHYVAMTRAKEELVIFTDKENVGVHTLESLGVMDFGRANNQNIITMAQHGLYDVLIEDSNNKLFGANSKYRLDI